MPDEKPKPAPLNLRYLLLAGAACSFGSAAAAWWLNGFGRSVVGILVTGVVLTLAFLFPAKDRGD
jgi:hypothetical protein